MKICVAQTKPVAGNVAQNIMQHKKLVNLAVLHGADLIIFPELSLTGYEPKLAQALATTKDDNRLDALQNISNEKGITIGAGMPLKSSEGVLIGMILFSPQQPRRSYAKQYLHEDETPYFIGGKEAVFLEEGGQKIALAICYELSVPAHAADAFTNGATIYIASVAKTEKGVMAATERLAAIARQYAVPVLMANCVGVCDGEVCAGHSSAWNYKGSLVAQLSSTSEGLIMMDTATEAVATYP